MEARIRVYIVDDYLIGRRGLALLLQEYPHIEVAGESDALKYATADIERIQPDVVLISLEISNPGVFDEMRSLSDLLPGTAVVIFLSPEDGELLVQAMQSGVFGYMSRSGDVDELVTAIRTVHSEGAYIHPHLLLRLAVLWGLISQE